MQQLVPVYRDKVGGKLTHTLEQYEKNMEQLTERLKKTDAVLVWANTTTVPEGEAGRKVGDDTKYDAAAARVMKKHDISINNLNALADSLPLSYLRAQATCISKPMVQTG